LDIIALVFGILNKKFNSIFCLGVRSIELVLSGFFHMADEHDLMPHTGFSSPSATADLLQLVSSANGEESAST
jgi:hypothetical protein